MGTVTDPTVTSVIEFCGGSMPSEFRESIIPTRYPYTYAYDFFRQNVPGNLARSECKPLIMAWCDANDRNYEQTVTALADAYLVHNNVKGWK